MEIYNSRYEIEPFFFGETSKELFGCYHRSTQVPARKHGILLCNPIGHEYIQSHRAFYQLATKLAKIGFHVLRFDYFGCGDSAGEFDQGSIHQWVSDIQMATNALKERSNQGSISLLGLRLGATLAAMVTEQNDVFDTLVLWEPVLKGRKYVEELLEMHKSFSRKMNGKGIWESDTPKEMLGFPLMAELKQDLEAIQLERIKSHPGMRLLTICNQSDVFYAEELVRLIQAQPQAENQTIGDHQVWCEELYKRLIPIRTIDFLVNWMDKAHS
jgi:uncharacterized protein